MVGLPIKFIPGKVFWLDFVVKLKNEDASEASIRVLFTIKLYEHFFNFSNFWMKRTNKGTSEANKQGYERSEYPSFIYF